MPETMAQMTVTGDAAVAEMAAVSKAKLMRGAELERDLEALDVAFLPKKVGAHELATVAHRVGLIPAAVGCAAAAIHVVLVARGGETRQIRHQRRSG